MSLSAPSLSFYADELVREKLITKDQLAVAKASQENLGEDLGSILIKKGFVTEQQILQFLSTKLSIPYKSIKNLNPDPELLREISVTTAQRQLVLPLKRNEKGQIEVAMANPLDTFALDDLKQAFGKEPVLPFLASATELKEAIKAAYKSSVIDSEASKKMIGIIEAVTEESSFGDLEFKKIEELASGPKVISAVNEMISQAWSQGASDIHIEPTKDSSRTRLRIDGILYERGSHAKNMHLALVSRIKIMSGLDIAERRVPQDGRVRIRLMGRTLDMRISTCPTQYGEKVVLRLLAKEALRNIEDLGFSEKDRLLFSEMVSKQHGIFLATGPTGSGKSTTLYAALMRINSPERNIISIEDPIESEIEGISQVAVNLKAGLQFATILRSVLRQDPDVVMIGEIRDQETANIAVRAAITGHFVLSTLHTNTAAGAITRLLDLKIEPFLLNTALKGVLAQRLVRKICLHCREELPPEKFQFGVFANLKKAFRGRGCSKCSLTGYSGRVGIFELAPINDAIRDIIYKRGNDEEIEKELRHQNFQSIRDEGLQKVESGVTTLEEVLRVTQED